MKKQLIVAVVLVLTAVIFASFIAVNNYLLPKALPALTPAPVYVGVTYCGDNSVDAKLLIDKVKTYTNLFVIQSGELEKNTLALINICDYAVSSGLHIIVYFSAVPTYRQYITDFLANAPAWGNSFLGIYFDDEPGGKILDSQNNIYFYDKASRSIIEKTPTFLGVTKADDSKIVYINDGSIEVSNADGQFFYESDTSISNQVDPTTVSSAKYIINPNGTIYLRNEDNTLSELNNPTLIPKISTYQQLLTKKPFQTYDSAAEIYVDTIQNSTSWPHSQTQAKLFTSDYALYWYDYLGGFDAVFAEIGWNNSAQQQIAMVRGAANMQNKDWGAIITWKYTYPERVNFPSGQYGPFLESGAEMYDHLRHAYEAGAKYLVVFNYPTYPANNPYGVLQEEHFSALKKLWTDTINNQTIVNGGLEAKAALILPNNYGGGLRSQQDNIWGLWQPDNNSLQVWNAMQGALTTYGSRLDIIYDNPAYPASNKYTKIINWNQTS